MEQHLAALERLFAEESRKKIERGVAIFSFIAVPFTVFAALIAVIGLPKDIDIIRDGPRELLDVGVWFLLGFCAAIPFSIYVGSIFLSRSRPWTHIGAARFVLPPV